MCLQARNQALSHCQANLGRRAKKTRSARFCARRPSKRRGHRHSPPRGLVPAPHAPHTSTASNRCASAALGLSLGRCVGSCALTISGVERCAVFTVHAAARSAGEELVRASRAHPVVCSLYSPPASRPSPSPPFPATTTSFPRHHYLLSPFYLPPPSLCRP